MQKTKRIILLCLLSGPADRLQIRQQFAARKNPTNAAELMRNLKTLEEKKCIANDSGIYSINKKGKHLLSLLSEVDSLLK